LYNEIFTDPTDPGCRIIETRRWQRAYNQFSEVTKSNPTGSEITSPVQTIATILLRNSDDVFQAWMLAAFVPWARETPKPPDKSSTKRPPSPASLAAREGIKADNKITKLVDDAVYHLQDIITIKDATNNDDSQTTSPLKRKQGAASRESQGQAIRTWGSHWRSSVVYTFLTQVAETETPAGT
jgi:hypothetical protein